MSTQTATTQQTTKTTIPSTILEVKDGKAKLRIESSPKGKRYRQPIETWLPLNMTRAEESLYHIIWESLSPSSPSLIPFAFESPAIMKLAKYLSRQRSGSRQTIHQYIYMTYRYCSWNNVTPDQIVTQCFCQDVPDLKAVSKEIQRLDDYLAELKVRNLAPKTISDQFKAIKMFYMVNSITVALPYRLSNRRTNRDRSPTPEELSRMIEVGDIREKLIVACLALAGFRVGTLAKLQYRHVRADLEKKIIPVHVHVEAEITKGKYSDYDSFLGAEAVAYLRAYLDMRRQGSPCGKIPPETITDNSPLIRDERGKTSKAVEGKQIYRVVHNLYLKTSMLERVQGRRYTLCAHSIRKFFRTQMAALGVPTEPIEYMMGHTITTYNDIQMKGVDFLRNIYAASGLSIKPKTQLSKIDTLKEIIRAWGMNPEQILTREALTQPHRTVLLGPSATEETQVQALSSALKDMMRKELLSMKDDVKKE